MTTPISRFIGSWSDWRANPFTGADMATAKTEDHIPVPASTPYLLQLLEVPRKDGPSSVVIYNYTDGITMTEVAHAVPPTQGQYAVDYPSPDGLGTGLIRFHSNDAGKDLRVTYYGTGSPVVTAFLDALVPWPSATPGANQLVIFKANVPTWAYNPVRMFHSENVIYSAAAEDDAGLVFDFKMGANESAASLRLKGAKMHQGYYLEIGEHLHAKGTIAASAGGSHNHTIATHGHGNGTLAGSQPAHAHTYYAADGTGKTTQNSGNDAVTITGAIAGSGILTTNTEPNHGHSISGSTALYSPVVKTYSDSLKVYIDGVDKTANILALSGLAQLGDGTSGHAFVTSGTGELDCTSLLGAGPWHELKITEPIAARGGRVLCNIELY